MGFTLVEVLIALAILGIAIIPLARVLDINLFGSAKAKKMRGALNLAVQEMEEVKNSPLPEKEMQGKTYTIDINGQQWRVIREIIPNTDPLEIRVHVYRPEDTDPAVTLVTLREDLQWNPGN